jgi:hypothetical protein
VHERRARAADRGDSSALAMRMSRSRMPRLLSASPSTRTV